MDAKDLLPYSREELRRSFVAMLVFSARADWKLPSPCQRP